MIDNFQPQATPLVLRDETTGEIYLIIGWTLRDGVLDAVIAEPSTARVAVLAWREGLVMDGSGLTRRGVTLPPLPPTPPVGSAPAPPAPPSPEGSSDV